MSINTAHANGGVLIHSGEYILLHNKNACIMFSEQKSPVFQGQKYGCIYLTSHRMIFKSKRQSEMLLSFSAPFIAMIDVELETPSNYLKGIVRAQPNGNFTGEVKFTLHFKSGGVVEYAKALQCAAAITRDSWPRKCIYPDTLPPYTPSRAWYEAPEAAYTKPKEYYKWLPVSNEFSSPKPNSVFMTDNPAPYPGIGKIKRCRECDPFKEPSYAGRCPTPQHSFGGFGQPPIYGLFFSSHLYGIFPHQAAYPPCDQIPDCEPYDLSDPYVDMYEDGYSNYPDQVDDTARTEFMHEDECSHYKGDTTARIEYVHEERYSNAISDQVDISAPEQIDTTVKTESIHGGDNLNKDDTTAPPEEHDQVDITMHSESMHGDKNETTAPPEDGHPDQVDTTVRSESVHGDDYLGITDKDDINAPPNKGETTMGAAPTETIHEDVYSNYTDKDNNTAPPEDQYLNNPDEVDTTAPTETIHEDVYSNYLDKDNTTAPPEDQYLNNPDEVDTTTRLYTTIHEDTYPDKDDTTAPPED